MVLDLAQQDYRASGARWPGGPPSSRTATRPGFAQLRASGTRRPASCGAIFRDVFTIAPCHLADIADSARDHRNYCTGASAGHFWADRSRNWRATGWRSRRADIDASRAMSMAAGLYRAGAGRLSFRPPMPQAALFAAGVWPPPPSRCWAGPPERGGPCGRIPGCGDRGDIDARIGISRSPRRLHAIGDEVLDGCSRRWPAPSATSTFW